MKRLFYMLLFTTIALLSQQITLAASSTIKVTPTGGKTNIQHNKKKTIMIVIDPGHGGKDSGAIGPDHIEEKNVVLAISQDLKHSIEKYSGFKAKLTRNKDTFIPLRQRMSIARYNGAGLLLAIHADAIPQNESVSGASVFALSEHGATSEMARWLAKKENESELFDGLFVSIKDRMLKSVLLDLSQNHSIDVSLRMGQSILNQLSNVTTLHDKTVEQAGFVVLKSPDIPSLLIETGYISNPAQEQKLNDPNYQKALADAIAKGVVSYFQNKPI